MTEQQFSAATHFDEDHLQSAQFDARLYNKLREIIHAAAEDQPQLPVFIERLSSHGVAFVAQMSKSGRVTGVNYAYQGFQVKASTLGTEYTWSGVQRKLGVHYVAQRDNPLLAVEALVGDAPTSMHLSDHSPLQAMLPLGDEESAPLALATPGSSDEPMRETPTRAVALASFDARNNSDLDSLLSSDRHVIAAVSDTALTPDDDDNNESTPGNGAMGVLDVEEAMAKIASPAIALSAADGSLSQSTPPDDAAPEHVEPSVSLAQLNQLFEQAHHMVNEARAEVSRVRQESWRLALTSAAVAGLIAALAVGLWVGQRTEHALARASAGIVHHIDDQNAADPVRAYFDKLVKRQNGAAK